MPDPRLDDQREFLLWVTTDAAEISARGSMISTRPREASLNISIRLGNDGEPKAQRYGIHHRDLHPRIQRVLSWQIPIGYSAGYTGYSEEGDMIEAT